MVFKDTQNSLRMHLNKQSLEDRPALKRLCRAAPKNSNTDVPASCKIARNKFVVTTKNTLFYCGCHSFSTNETCFVHPYPIN